MKTKSLTKLGLNKSTIIKLNTSAIKSLKGGHDSCGNGCSNPCRTNLSCLDFCFLSENGLC